MASPSLASPCSNFQAFQLMGHQQGFCSESSMLAGKWSPLRAASSSCTGAGKWSPLRLRDDGHGVEVHTVSNARQAQPQRHVHSPPGSTSKSIGWGDTKGSQG